MKRALMGSRNQSDSLWDITISKTVASSTLFCQRPAPNCNVIIRIIQSHQVLAKYLHSYAGFPPISTFVKAIAKGNFITWPGITDISFSKTYQHHYQRIKVISTRNINKLQLLQTHLLILIHFLHHWI